MANETIRDKLIKAGVRNLKQFGYPTVNAENILTDDVYKAFFRRMLENDAEMHDGATLKAIRKLVAELYG